MNPERRLTFKQLASITLLAAGSPSVLIQHALAAGNKPISPGLHKIKGDVRINGRAAQEGQMINATDTVSTGLGAEAIYVIGQDAFLQRENSVVRFGKEATQDFFRVVSGKLLSVFGKGEKKLLTPTATIGIRGTGCYIEAENTRVYFCLCYGEAELSSLAEPAHTERIVATHHDQPVYIHQDKGRPNMVAADMINHSDAELTLLENLSGRWPPFYGINDYGKPY